MNFGLCGHCGRRDVGQCAVQEADAGAYIARLKRRGCPGYRIACRLSVTEAACDCAVAALWTLLANLWASASASTIDDCMLNAV